MIRATAIYTLLTTVLATPASEDNPDPVHIEESSTVIRVWAEIPPTLAEPLRLEVLEFLRRTADRFGHTIRRSGQSVLWAEVSQSRTQATSQPKDAS
jgi:hypothetical protein